MRENKSQRQGKSWQGEKRERNREKEKGGRKTEMMARKRQRGRETEAVRIRVGGEPPPGPAPRAPPCLTVPAWGCPHCHTSHTRGSADTRGRSGSGHSSGTVALSARCRVMGVGLSEPPLPWSPPSPPGTLPPGPHLSSQPRQPPCGYRAR